MGFTFTAEFHVSFASVYFPAFQKNYLYNP